ncbi:alpha/beta fold hydrolase [uncultured Erythrobacter sp.]|uniref:alpha/beta fold hydrolase n=1 Tax=uncultured Erythrobacter sp. TaxID=263913 RepID=UPI00261DBC46|nr:alpha/beta fold hydrolase [uncultured Erythrobacter sp.]
MDEIAFMVELNSSRFASFDGANLAVTVVGEGRPLVLVHGLFSSAEMNWIKFGHTAKLVEAGFQVIMPHLRAHGASTKSHHAGDYPVGVLTKDLAALVEHFDLSDYDLGGFSLGARTSAKGVIDGLTPRRLALCGMGLQGLSGWKNRSSFFIDAIDRFDEIKRGDRAFMAKSFMKTMGIDREAARLLLGAVDDVANADLAKITMPTALICGNKDQDNGSAKDLAMALPDGRYREIPGTHMSSVADGAFGNALVEFFAD